MYHIPHYLSGGNVYAFFDTFGNDLLIHSLPVKAGLKDIKYASGKYYLFYNTFIDIIDEETQEIVETMSTTVTNVVHGFVSPDGRWLAVTSGYHSGHPNILFDMQTGQNVYSMSSSVKTEKAFLTNDTAVFQLYTGTSVFKINKYYNGSVSSQEWATNGTLQVAVPFYLNNDHTICVAHLNRPNNYGVRRYFVFDIATLTLLTPTLSMSHTGAGDPIIIDNVVHVRGNTILYSCPIGGDAWTQTTVPSLPLSYLDGDLAKGVTGFSYGAMAVNVQNDTNVRVVDYSANRARLISGLGFAKPTTVTVEGSIKDITGNNAKRKIGLLHPETFALLSVTESDPVTGAYSLPITGPSEVIRIIRSEDNNRNDIVDRIVLT